MAGQARGERATAVPEIWCPFPEQVNPHLEAGRSHLRDWVGAVGLVHRDSARQRFERADFGWFAALVYPTADLAGLELTADWFAWLFLVDDHLDDGGFGRDPAQVARTVAGMRAVVDSPDLGAAAARDSALPTAVSSLADLWSRTAVHAPPPWRRRFVGHLEDCLTAAAVWEAGNRVRGRVPGEQEYIDRRRDTGAIYVCMDLIDVVERLDVPELLYRSPEFGAALDAACNVVCWTNDLYSLDKERSLGEVHNLAYLVEYHRGLDRDQAVAEVSAATSRETRHFLAAERDLLAAHPGHARLLAPYLAGMRSWMRGNLDWSGRTARYRACEQAPDRPSDYVESALLGAEG